MQSFEIGLSGLDAARKGLDVIGNNIANASTEGYHRQKVDLTPSRPTYDGQFSWGTGVDVGGITRAIDNLLESEIVYQEGISGQIEQELLALRTVESSFGEFSSDGGLNQGLNNFFNAIQDLASHPLEVTWQRQFVTAAQSLSNLFQTMGTSLADMEGRIDLQILDTMDKINELATQISELNFKIQKSEVGGAPANNLRDQRDQRITELSKLVEIDTRERDYGVVDVTAAGISLVLGADTVTLELGDVDSDTVGIGAVGTSLYREHRLGKLGGLLTVKNDLLAGIRDQLDTLAGSLVKEINSYHVMGVGSEGSFSDLTGWSVDSNDPLDSLDLGITDGSIYIRVVETSNGEVSRTTINVDASADTLEDIATRISAATGLSASVISNRLRIEAEAGYEFDFLPAPLPEPDTTTFATPADAPSLSVSGIYTGDANDTLTFTVQGGGTVGNGDWSIEVTNSDGDTVAILDAGSAYVAGEDLDLGNGIKVRLGVGTLADADMFTVKAYANTDTSGLLAAVGINSFFSGTGAQTMAVVSRFDDYPGLVATALGPDCADNLNVSRMLDLRDTALTDLNNRTIGDYYQTLVTTIGQDITTRKMRQDNSTAMLQNLRSRRNETSGVDINDEAAKLLMYEQMYQAMAKFLNSVRTATDTLLELL